MKKIYLSILALAMAGATGAQTLGNLDLENWTGNNPDSWTYFESQLGGYTAGTQNYLTQAGEPASTFEETSNPAGGSGSSARIEVVQAAPNGVWEQNAGTSEIPGILLQHAPTTDKSTTMEFDIFAEPIDDTVIVQVLYWSGPSQDTIGLGQKVYTSAQNDWSNETMQIQWVQGSGNPDSLEIFVGFASGQQNVGSLARVDNFTFSGGGTTSITENNINGVKLYPNPASNNITVESNNQAASDLVIMSVTGNVVSERKLKNSTETIDVSHLNSGVYIYQVRNEVGSVIETKKLVIK